MLPHDPATVSTAASLVNTALSATKQAIELAKRSKDTTLKDQISEVYDYVLDLKSKVLELQEENAELRKKLEDKRKISRKGPHGYFFIEGDPDPLCPTCYEGDHKIVHLPAPETWNRRPRRLCRVCTRAYYEADAPPVTPSNPEPSPWT